ncbi:NAD(P)H-binding protein [Saccharopolyspora sp. SCSIO 74807]|uniref:NmrA family NAD(P)-binding protein n=1 Tax=Saccharopolyspora sp. SCSIO 74807 TaxID=3118084 RepID=UPI0030D591DA
MAIAAKDRGTVAVTGATGALGSRIAARLADGGVPQLLIGRDPSRLPELPFAEKRGPAAYDDAAAMRSALDGASTLVLISSHPTGKRLEEHASAVQAGMDVGVGRVLYVSLIGAAATATYRNARDHWLTEQYLAGAGVRHTVFRAGFYASTPAALADEEFTIRGPGGDGRVAFTTHDDIAATITGVATDESTEHDGAVLEVTGPESLTLAEAVPRIAEATGKPYRYEPETLPEAFARRWRLGISGTQIEAWISWYQAIAGGELDKVTDVVPRITGSPATPIREAGWWPAPKTAR